MPVNHRATKTVELIGACKSNRADHRIPSGMELRSVVRQTMRIGVATTAAVLTVAGILTIPERVNAQASYITVRVVSAYIAPTKSNGAAWDSGDLLDPHLVQAAVSAFTGNAGMGQIAAALVTVPTAARSICLRCGTLTRLLGQAPRCLLCNFQTLSVFN